MEKVLRTFLTVSGVGFIDSKGKSVISFGLKKISPPDKT